MRIATLGLVLTCGLSLFTSAGAQNLQTDQDKTFYALGLAIGGNINGKNQAQFMAFRLPGPNQQKGRGGAPPPTDQ